MASPSGLVLTHHNNSTGVSYYLNQVTGQSFAYSYVQRRWLTEATATSSANWNTTPQVSQISQVSQVQQRSAGDPRYPRLDSHTRAGSDSSRYSTASGDEQNYALAYGNATPSASQLPGGFTQAFTQLSVNNNAQSNQRRERRIRATPGEQELLDKSYRRRKSPATWFTEGKVFLTLWSEPTTKSVDSSPTDITEGILGESVFHRIRRFVVIREGHGSCIALPIATYTRQGVGKPGVKKSEHAIIYSSTKPSDPAPPPLPQESAALGENNMQPRAIRVEPHERGEKLDPLSRINFGKLYTIEHNVKVKGFGKVANLSDLKIQFSNVFNQGPRPHSSLAGPSGSTQAPSASTSSIAPNVRQPQQRPSNVPGSSSRHLPVVNRSVPRSQNRSEGHGPQDDESDSGESSSEE